MSKWYWKNGTNRFLWCRVGTNPQFVKNVVSVKCDKAKHNKQSMPVYSNVSQFSSSSFPRKEIKSKQLFIIKSMLKNKILLVRENFIFSFQIYFLYFFFLSYCTGQDVKYDVEQTCWEWTSWTYSWI